MDLQMSVINLQTNLKLTAQHTLNKELEVTRYPPSLTAIVISAISCNSGLQITKVNKKLTLLEFGGGVGVEIKWEYYDLDDTRKAVQKVTSDFILLSCYLSGIFNLIYLFSLSSVCLTYFFIQHFYKEKD